MTVKAGDLEDLYESIRQDAAFDHLRLGKNPLVPGEGRDKRPLAFIIGEAPGANEVMALRPFVGAAGKVLRQLMEAADLYSVRGIGAWWDSHSEIQPNVWLTNVVKYRPPRNRTPTLPEIESASPYLHREWELVGKPELIITVGGTALSAVMKKPVSISEYAGLPFRTRNGVIIWPMFHPAYGLRNEAIRPEMEQHWKALGKRLKKGLYSA